MNRYRVQATVGRSLTLRPEDCSEWAASEEEAAARVRAELELDYAGVEVTLETLSVWGKPERCIVARVADPTAWSERPACPACGKRMFLHRDYYLLQCPGLCGQRQDLPAGDAIAARLKLAGYRRHCPAIGCGKLTPCGKHEVAA